MADHDSPGAAAPDEGERVPASPVKQAPAHDAAPAPKLAFERWAVEKMGIVFSQRGRASGIKNGKPVKNGIRSAALVNAARAHHRIPIGKTMTEAEFNAAISATKALEVR